MNEPSRQDGERMVAPTFIPRRREGLMELDLDDGLILYDPQTSLVHHLNPSAAVVWQGVRGGRPVGALVREIAEVHGLDAEEAGEQIRGLIRRLESLGLVEDEGSTNREGADERDEGTGGEEKDP